MKGIPDPEEYAMIPGYLLEVSGVPVAITYSFWDGGEGDWLLVDRDTYEPLRAFESFRAVAAALQDGAWIREKHDEAVAAGIKKPDESREEKELLNRPFYRIDNPPKGRPGIVLVPSVSYLGSDDDDEDLIIDDAWEDDWEDDFEDWNDEDEEWAEADAEEAALPADAKDVVDDEEDDEDWDDEDWDDEDWDDEDWDDEDWEFDDDDSDVEMTLIPRAAYVIVVGKDNPIAFYTAMTAGPSAWWEAFDVAAGVSLWNGQSLSELIRVAPLFMMILRHTTHFDDMITEYHDLLEFAFEDSTRQTAEDYTRTGYLKANGREYLDILNRLYQDPVILEDLLSTIQIEGTEDDESEG